MTASLNDHTDRLSGIRRKCLILIFIFFSHIELIHFTAAHALNFDVA